ncbi:RNA polymerase sigma-E factor [metagenome]|uniref:RNA polymerase sigma-E factor n=1 Tax=metagenome TaxID=256318 RepID=A0A2P2BYX9_9ZZZZ
MRRSVREAEFVTFVAARRVHFRRIAYALCGDWNQAEDLVQVALVKLYVAWPRVCRDGREEAYVRQILVRANIDEHRRPWHRERPTDDVPDRSSYDGADAEVRDALVRALQELPLMQRRTVVMRHWLGLSVEETAGELGIAPGTVKTHCSRGLERLQSVLMTEEH